MLGAEAGSACPALGNAFDVYSELGAHPYSHDALEVACRSGEVVKRSHGSVTRGVRAGRLLINASQVDVRPF